MAWCAGYGMDSAAAFALGMGSIGGASVWTGLSPAEKSAVHQEAVDRALAQAGKV